VLDRVELLRRFREVECARRQNAILRRVLNGEISRLEGEIHSEEAYAEFCAGCARLDKDITVLRAANQPHEVAASDEEFAREQSELRRIADLRYPAPDGLWQPLLLPAELHALSVRRGNLTPDEYAQIQRHATASYNFLRQIPWTEDLQNVPHIAHCHHEKLNGTGYPRRLKGDQIPLGARLMTVADIYDALTAAERPYKRALTSREALRILEAEAASGCLDRDVLELFISRRIYRVNEGWMNAPASPSTGNVLAA
jgi:hypothetical protein